MGKSGKILKKGVSYEKNNYGNFGRSTGFRGMQPEARGKILTLWLLKMRMP